MIRFYVRLGLAILSGVPALAIAQAPVPTVEYTVHYGDYGDGQDLTGYVTYDVYLEFAASAVNPKLTTVFSAQPDLGAEYVITVDAPCGLFQHDQGGETVEGAQCFVLPFFQSLEYDSFWTIGNSCKANTDQQLFTVTTDQPALDAWENTVPAGNFFDGPPNLNIGNTAFFRLPTDPLSNPVNGRILIGRFTSCGDVCINYAIQYFNNYTGPGAQFQTAIQQECFEHPCLTFPVDATAEVTSLGCEGGTQVELEDGGFGAVTYSLFEGTPGSGTLVDTYPGESNGLTIAGIANGTYYIESEDEAGCLATSDPFTVTEPAPVSIEATLLQDVLCFGANIGSIEVICEGGAGTPVTTMNGAPVTCGILQNLSCGTYDFMIEDDNGCTDEVTIQLTCPAELADNLTFEDISCFAADDGQLTGTISGGTGAISVSIENLTSGDVQTLNGTGTVNVNLTNLTEGDYEVFYSDVNLCNGVLNFTIVEPAEFSATFTTTDASCFDFCDGTVVFDIVGGTGTPTTAVTATGGGAANANALCAGNYNYVITDANQCEVTGQITIGEPADIVSAVTPVAESCFQLCDGEILLTNTTGGFGGYTYELSPNTGLCVDPCSGASATFNSLCGGAYSVTITDSEGCEKTLSNISISSPAAITVSLAVQNVSCNGFGDGEVTVTASGGTGVLTASPGGEPLPFVQGDLVPGTFTFTVEDANGCSGSADAIITEPALLIATALETIDVLCGGQCNGAIQYLVEGGTIPYSYQLEPNGTTGAFSGIIGSLCVGEYDLLTIDLNDCVDTLSFTISEPPALFIDVLLDAPTCTGMTDGSAIILTGGGTGEVTTIFDPDDYEITENAPGNYSISSLGETQFVIDIFDENECTLQEVVNVIPDIITDMVITTYSSPETCWNQMDGTATVAVQNGFLPLSYEWNDPEAQTTPVATGLASNEVYSVTVTDDIGCNLTVQVEVDPTIGCFFIANALTPNGDGANDFWLIGGLEFFPEAKVQVFNRWGQVVFESTGYPSPWNGSFEGELLPVADYYFIIDYSKDFDPIMGTVTIKY
jgi:gliding motility-associated-like protein